MLIICGFGELDRRNLVTVIPVKFANVLLLLLLLLLKPAAQAQVGKTKLFINWFRNPTST